MKFEQDQVVRRTDQSVGEVKAGTLGKVAATFDDGWFRVQWKGHLRDEIYPPSTEAVEPADAPAVGAPGDAFRAAIREEVDAGMRQLHAQDERSLAAMYSSQQPQTQYGLGGWEPADVTQLKAELDKEREARKQTGERCCELQRELAEVMQRKTTERDIMGDNQALRADVARLEGDVAWLRRENIRLGGKSRGAR